METEIHGQTHETKESNTQQSLVSIAEKHVDKGKTEQSPKLNLINFPPLSPFPVRNRFEAMSNSKYEVHILPGDRGRSSNQLK